MNSIKKILPEILGFLTGIMILVVAGYVFLMLGLLAGFNPVGLNIVAKIDVIQMDILINKSSGFLMTGVLVVAFAYALKSGLRIYEEQKLTV